MTGGHKNNYRLQFRSFFKIKELLQLRRTAFCAAVFLETLYKISRQTDKLFWCWRLGNMATYDFYLFCFQFTIKILLTLFLQFSQVHMLFLLVVDISFLKTRDLKISTEIEKHVILKPLTIEEHNKKKNRELEKVER